MYTKPCKCGKALLYLKTRSMSREEINNKRQLRLPTVEEFYMLSFSSYADLVLKKILMHFHGSDKECLSTENEQKTVVKYQELTDDELTRRGYFLQIIHQYVMLIKTISSHLNDAEDKCEMQLTVPFDVWLTRLMLTEDELKGLSVLKKQLMSNSFANIFDFKRKLLFLLYQTQIIVLQMLLKICQFQLSVEERLIYQRQLLRLKRRHYIIEETQQPNALNGNKNSANKWQKNKKKGLLKQINRLVNFYHVEISMSRQSAKIKPEVNCLLQLLKVKCNQTLFRELLQKTKLGQIYRNSNLSVKSTGFSPFILVPVKEETTLRQSLDQKKLTICQVSSFYLENINSTQSLEKNRKIEQLQTPTQRQKVSQKKMITEGSDKIKSAAKTVQSEQDSPPKKNKKEILINSQSRPEKELLTQPRSSIYKHRRNKLSVTMTGLSNHQKLSFIGLHQRFGQNMCDFSKKLVKPKKQHDISEEDKSSSRHQIDCIPSIRQFPVSNASFSQIEDNCLIWVDETPIERPRAFLHPSEE